MKLYCKSLLGGFKNFEVLGLMKKNFSSQNVGASFPASTFKPKAYKGASYDKYEPFKKHNVSWNMTYYKKPVLISQGHMQWVFDESGKRYLDMFAGIATVSVGHCHPKVVEAISEQVQTLWHTTNIYYNSRVLEYVEKLLQKFPQNLKVCYLVNSGSEANDLAMALARTHTGNFDIISLRNSYHGGSPYCLGLTAQSKWKPSFPTNIGIHHAMNPNIYSGLWGGSRCRDSPVQTTRKCDCHSEECEACEYYIKDLEEIFISSVANGKLAGFFAEPVQGLGGMVQYPKHYLKKAYELIQKQGGLFIADEVQSGFGRTGEHFWGFQMHDIVPDIVTSAKGIANGLPMGAVITTPEIAQSFSQHAYINTFSGNPVVCAAAEAVLDVIAEENMQENCVDVGTFLLKELEKLRDQFEIIGDVRGKGLMIGIEFVKNKESRRPLPIEEISKIWESCKDYGILIGLGGGLKNVFRIQPPMCITIEDANYTIEVLKTVLSNYEKGILN